jgi:anti-sigma factor RsiW
MLPLLADEELGPVRRLRASRHIASCPACSARLDSILSVRSAVQTRLPYHRAPPGLAARIGAALPRVVPPPPVLPWYRRPAIGFGGAGLAGAVAGVALMLLVTSGPGTDERRIADLAIDSHVRSMMAEHLTDVPTSDQHTVKPWLTARSEVAPTVPDLSAEGFVLVGGRLDYIDGRQATAVVYRRRQHVINLFAWRTGLAAQTGLHAEQRRGFNLVTWRSGGVEYAAVSDLDPRELMQFARLVAGLG